MTTGHSIANLYNFDDPLGSSQFCLSSWQGPCLDVSDSDDSDDEDDDDGEWHFSAASSKKKPLPQEKPTAEAPQRESSSSSCSNLPVCVRSTGLKVRFSEHPQVRCYEQVDRELFGLVYYSCHELQVIMDEAKREDKETKTN